MIRFRHTIASIALGFLAAAPALADGNAFFDKASSLLKTYSGDILHVSQVCETHRARNGQVTIANVPDCRLRVRARLDTLRRKSATAEDIAQLRALEHFTGL